MNFAKFLKNTFFTEHLQTTAFVTLTWDLWFNNKYFKKAILENAISTKYIYSLLKTIHSKGILSKYTTLSNKTRRIFILKILKSYALYGVLDALYGVLDALYGVLTDLAKGKTRATQLQRYGLC